MPHIRPVPAQPQVKKRKAQVKVLLYSQRPVNPSAGSNTLPPAIPDYLVISEVENLHQYRVNA